MDLFDLKPSEEETAEIKARLDKLRDQMSYDNVELMIITNMEDIFYLTNYQTVGRCVQVLLVTHHDIHMVTRELESTNVRYRCHVSFSFYNESQDPLAVIVEEIKRMCPEQPSGYIGLQLDTEKLTYRQINQLQNDLSFIHPNATISDVSHTISKLRRTKSQLEVSKITRAAGMVHAGLQAGISKVVPGMMETEAGGIVVEAMCRMGCEYTAYPVFLCSGEMGCLGHYTPTQKIVKEGEVLFFEIGGCFNRYHAARMYSIYMGEKAPEWFTLAETLIRKAVNLGKAIMKPGTAAKDVDKVMRDVISEYPYPHKQSERSGYSIGIGFYTDWCDSTTFYINPTSSEVLEENMTIHLIPWIQIPDKGALGFSDTVLVTSEGSRSLFDGQYYGK